jgi:membrane protein YqaA with SNARE-associated domain
VIKVFTVLGAFFVDVVPVPLPPAFTVMIFLQVKFQLKIWLVVIIGVIGSLCGRYLLTLYIPKLSGKIFRDAKNEDVQFLGTKMKEKGWKGLSFVLIYSLMPLPTTPLFIAAGMAKLKPIHIIPAFFIGKVISDLIAVMIGKYASENTADLLQGALSWKSIAGLSTGLLLVFMLLFIDWRTLLQKNKLVLKFKIFK